MNVSLNEIDATAKKAARGAGYPWGLAEEAGKATRWLCRHNIDGCAALANLLDEMDGRDIASISPSIEGQNWAAAGTVVCPLVAGAAISDRAQGFGSQGIELRNVVSPILLAPFLASIAQQLNVTIRLTAETAELHADGQRVSIIGEFPSLSHQATATIGSELLNPNELCRRAFPDRTTWKRLNSFARRTYAPATDESRLMGAGAGLSDND